MRCIVLAPLLCSVLFTLGHAAEEATTTAAPQGVEDPDKPTEYINGTAVSSWHDEEFKEFLRSGSMDKEEKVRHLLRVAGKHYNAWREEQKRANASEAGAWAMMQASQAYGEAFNAHDTSPDLVTEGVAHRLYQMLQHTGPTTGGVKTIQGAQAILVLQQSLLSMLARVAEVATAMVYEPSVSAAEKEEYYALGKKWLVTLMAWHFDSSSSKWRLYKKQLLNNHMLPDDFKRPDIEHPVVGKLVDAVDINYRHGAAGGDMKQAVQQAARARQEADDRMDKVSGEAQKEALGDKMAASQEKVELR